MLVHEGLPGCLAGPVILKLLGEVSHITVGVHHEPVEDLAALLIPDRLWRRLTTGRPLRLQHYQQLGALQEGSELPLPIVPIRGSPLG